MCKIECTKHKLIEFRNIVLANDHYLIVNHVINVFQDYEKLLCALLLASPLGLAGREKYQEGA